MPFPFISSLPRISLKDVCSRQFDIKYQEYRKVRYFRDSGPVLFNLYIVILHILCIDCEQDWRTQKIVTTEALLMTLISAVYENKNDTQRIVVPTLRSPRSQNLSVFAQSSRYSSLKTDTFENAKIQYEQRKRINRYIIFQWYS